MQRTVASARHDFSRFSAVAVSCQKEAPNERYVAYCVCLEGAVHYSNGTLACDGELSHQQPLEAAIHRPVRSRAVRHSLGRAEGMSPVVGERERKPHRALARVRIKLP